MVPGLLPRHTPKHIVTPPCPTLSNRIMPPPRRHISPCRPVHHLLHPSQLQPILQPRTLPPPWLTPGGGEPGCGEARGGKAGVGEAGGEEAGGGNASTNCWPISI